MIDVVCNLCGQDDWVVQFPATMNGRLPDVSAFRCTSAEYGSHAQIVRCNQCGLVYANPRWSDEELVALYEAVEDNTYSEEREGRELTFRKHLQAMERVVGQANGRSLLDVGAYIGVFVEVAQQAGWNAYGVEPSQWAVDEARRHGLSLIQGTQDAPALAGCQFDVVTMWDVIEHVTDPGGEIAKARRLLKPGGWLLLHTMDSDSKLARLMGGRWPWLMDMHLTYFSQKTLAALLEKHGFEVIWSGAQGRYLRLGYVATRIAGLNRPLGRLAQAIVYGLHLQETAVPLNFGDLFTIYARHRLE